MEERIQNIQWFPGHMTKTLRLIEANLKNVDIIVELLDARVPGSSKNPSLEKLTRNKPRLLLLNKSDLADPNATAWWIAYYKKQGYGAAAVASKEKKVYNLCVSAIKETLAPMLQKRSEKGMAGAKIRAMIVGVPNVGKSTFINNLAGYTAAKAEDRPGVTRGKQWISLKEIELLDMPGVLWPKFEDQHGARLLAFTGSIKDDVVDMVELAICLAGTLRDLYPDRLCSRYKLREEDLTADNLELLEQIARKRGMMLRGGELDLERAAIMLLDELRGGKLGRITFEEPQK